MAQRLLGAKDLLVEPEPSPSVSQRQANGWGKVLISASNAGERSWESEQLRNSVFTRFRDWVKADIWMWLFEAVSNDPDKEYAMVDATIVKVHRHGQGAKGGPKARRSAARKAA